MMAHNQELEDSKFKQISREMDSPTQQQQLQLSTSLTGTFSIATPTVTTFMPMTENMTDASFMMPATSFTQDSYLPMSSSNNMSRMVVGQSTVPKMENIEVKQEPNNTVASDMGQTESNYQNNPKPSDQVPEGMQFIEMKTAVQDNAVKEVSLNNSTTGQESSKQKEHHLYRSDNSLDDGGSSKICKKRNKLVKKSTKLDAKSKLEKSRQSARECRARKKLRYQYLEDLVCNREKAVVKLREELSMFCELSKQMDSGTISDQDAKSLLIDQTKENNQNEAS